MGLRRQKRNRLESARGFPEEVLYSLGTENIKYEKFDEQILYDKINAKLDKQQQKINSKL